ncbi:hypothetical protein DFH08DRAFT_977874 [Mycena albidolilacea]|uniref:Uncharacterized protein n=1 Tax=Mycena albidolilacea TaxID=1033008 RepID=A0AAD7E917_9AGAR|nr:hypothetical protein DFH08DRAFT_977874 [Mycena albidolilacea]
MFTLLLSVTVLLCISATLNIFTIFHLRQTAGAYTSLDNEPLPSELPLAVGAVTLEFIFGKHYNIVNDAEWATLIPSNHGRVRLGVDQKEFDVAMYTDLQCLDTIRAAYVSMRGGSHVAFSAAEACLGHIRQTILCTADITLEPAWVICKDGECPLSSAAATGEFVDHKCRDWEQVRNYVQDNQAAWGGNSRD